LNNAPAAGLLEHRGLLWPGSSWPRGKVSRGPQPCCNVSRTGP
jgi:hypothetical protein